MPPLPKKKHSKKRQGGRSAHHALRPVSFVECPQCRSVKLPHRACHSCGYYKSRMVIPVESET